MLKLWYEALNKNKIFENLTEQNQLHTRPKISQEQEREKNILQQGAKIFSMQKLITKEIMIPNSWIFYKIL